MHRFTVAGHVVHVPRVEDVGAGSGPLVVLLHGMMGSADELFPLAAAGDDRPGMRFAFVEGPVELEGFARGRSFWPVDVGRVLRARGRGLPTDMSQHRPAGLDVARAGLRALVDALAVEAPVVLVGFSQGAMLAVDFALHEERPLAGLALFAPTVVDEAGWMPRLARLRGTPIAMIHGAHDPVLLPATGERLRDAMIAAGVDVTWRTFDGAHALPAEGARWLSDVLSRSFG